MKYCISLFVLLFSLPLAAQSPEEIVETGFAIANTQGSFSAAYIHNWKLGNNEKIKIGLGGRMTAYLGKNENYITAPAKLTSGKTGLGVIFTENIEENIDTLLVKTAQVNAINVLINLGYQFSDRLSFAFNIDLIGFSFGSTRRGNYMNGNSGQNVDSKPTTFNLLLTSDNDLGSLNSEFVLRYQINKKLTARGGLQFLFTEFTTTAEVQQFPKSNDRFRNKSAMFGVGISYTLK